MIEVALGLDCNAVIVVIREGCVVKIVTKILLGLILGFTIHLRVAEAAGVTRIGETSSDVKRIDKKKEPTPARTVKRYAPEPERPKPESAKPESQIGYTILSVRNASYRKWTSSQGTSVEARLLEITTTGAILLVSDGRRISVAQNQLSLRDRNYLSSTLALSSDMKKLESMSDSASAAMLLRRTIADNSDASGLDEARAMLLALEADIGTRTVEPLTRTTSQIAQAVPPPAPQTHLAPEALPKSREHVPKQQKDTNARENPQDNQADTPSQSDWWPSSSVGAWFGWWLLPAVAIFIAACLPTDVTTTDTISLSNGIVGTITRATGEVIDGDPSGGAMAAFAWLVGYLGYWLFYGWWH